MTYKENSSEMLTDWCGVCFLSPFCSNFSSSHFGCSSRAEKFRWCSWGQLCWQRGRGKHYLHYSWLERIYVQYLAFGTHAQVTTRLICHLSVILFYQWILSCKWQVFPSWCCSAPQRINHVDAVTDLSLVTSAAVKVTCYRMGQKLDNAIIYYIS